MRVRRPLAACTLVIAAGLLVSACGAPAEDATAPRVPSIAIPPDAAAPGPYPEGESVHVLDVDGIERTFLVHVPAGLTRPHAVVLVLHGGGGEGLGAAEVGEHPLAVFRTVADREGIVVVYPEGLPADDRRGRLGWVDCRADSTVSSGADDIGFLAALIASIGDAYGLPSSRRFMAGSSNGAQMTQAFAFHHPELLGAVASSAGSLPADPLPGPCTDGPARPVPILLVHGTADTQVPFDGGCVADLGGGCARGRVVSAVETRDRWLAINGLGDATPVETVIEVDPDDGGAAHRFVHDGATPVEWWRLDGAGHVAASRTVRIAANRLTGLQSRDVEFAEVAWSFFASRLPSDRAD